MNFIEYCIANKNFSAIKTIKEYTKVFGHNESDGVYINPYTGVGYETKNGVRHHKGPQAVKKALTEGYQKQTKNPDATYDDFIKAHTEAQIKKAQKAEKDKRKSDREANLKRIADNVKNDTKNYKCCK